MYKAQYRPCFFNSAEAGKFKAACGPGFGDTFPGINNIKIIKLLRLTELLILILIIGQTKRCVSHTIISYTHLIKSEYIKFMGYNIS